MTRVLIRRHEGRCAVCKSRAEEFNVWLARRLDGDTEGGKRITWDYLAETVAPILLGSKVDKRSLRRHFDNHCEVVSEEKAEEVAALDDEREGLVGSMLDRVKAGEKFDPDDALDFVIVLGVTELEARLKREGKAGVTVDQLVKAISEKTRRKSSDAQRELLGHLGGAIGEVFSGYVGGGDEPAELVEGEVIAEEDDGEVG